MKMFFALAAVAVFTTTAGAKVWTTVCRHDETTPLEAVDPNDPTAYRDIMAGTHLTIVISSDQGGYRFGGLIIDDESITRGELAARGPADKPWDYAGSCLYAAGDDAWIGPWIGHRGHGFQFNSTSDVPWRRAAVPGDWFILDYYARQTGPCAIEFYDFEADPETPVETLSVTHVPSRDFNADAIVDFTDFALLASAWRSALSADPNDPGIPGDLNADRSIDSDDLTLFADFWLEETDVRAGVVDPNAG